MVLARCVLTVAQTLVVVKRRGCEIPVATMPYVPAGLPQWVCWKQRRQALAQKIDQGSHPLIGANVWFYVLFVVVKGSAIC